MTPTKNDLKADSALVKSIKSVELYRLICSKLLLGSSNLPEHDNIDKPSVSHLRNYDQRPSEELPDRCYLFNIVAKIKLK